MKKIIIYGDGGHAKSCLDLVISTNNFKVIGFISKDKQKIGKEIYGHKIIGSDRDLPKLLKLTDNLIFGISFIYDLKKRKKLFNKLLSLGFKFPKIISKNSYISKYSKISEGVNIFHSCVIGPGVNIGIGTVINNFSLVEHDVKIGNNCHISTSNTINGSTVIGDNTFVGSGSIIVNNKKIQKNTFIKIGSIIKK
mgnify:CR=1 FL=1